MTNAPSSIADKCGENTPLAGMQQMTHGGRGIWGATAFFSLDALALLAGTLAEHDRVRIHFGDDAEGAAREEQQEEESDERVAALYGL